MPCARDCCARWPAGAASVVFAAVAQSRPDESGSRPGRRGRTGPWTAACPRARSTAAGSCSAANRPRRPSSPGSCEHARGGGLFQPQRRPVTERQELVPRQQFSGVEFAGAAPPAAAGNARRRPAGCPVWSRAWRATSTGPASPTCTITTCVARAAAPTPSARPGGAAPNRTRARTRPSGCSAATVRVTPNAAVQGLRGTGCSRARSCASISAGARRVTRCGRLVHLLAERRARRLELGEAVVLRQQVGVASAPGRPWRS